LNHIKHIKSPAKINLFLKVTGKRPDGYHELESLFAFLDLCDILRIEESDQFQLKFSGEFAPNLDEKNNFFTAILDFFTQEFSISPNLKISVEKNIPVSAGMGGGSSNAAYFIKALNEIFVLKLSDSELKKIALQFGSDIPFFLNDQAAIIRGRGEIIKNYHYFKPIPTLLINPRISLSTAQVFKNFNSNFSQKISDEEILNHSPIDLIKLPNDLTQAAIKITPEIGVILKELTNAGAVLSKMSGSGATCFAIFQSEASRDLAAIRFAKQFPQFFILRTRVISSYHDLA
jgi:4-diphosphocytidyl-2-C-methyl-D-erythritol kinase